MAASARICLDVAIDHRIRALFRDVNPPGRSGFNGGHVSTVKSLGSNMGRPPAEIDVTGQLAGPEATGGLVVILQQPRNNHPFDDGLEAVIQACPTLSALDELFYTVSCGTIDLDDVSVLDLVPFTKPQEVEDGKHDLSFLGDRINTCVEAVCQKKPDVVLCAGRLPRLVREELPNRCKGEAWKLENIGIRHTFQNSKGKDGTNVDIKGAAGGVSRIVRVNAPHPSFALHYRSRHYSCFRQLLLLAVSEVWVRYADDEDWTESAWMDTLRWTCEQSCQLLPHLGQGFGSEDQDEDEGEWTGDWIGDWIGFHYCSLLKEISQAIRSIAKPHADPYQSLVDNSLTTLLNDASLACRYMDQIDEAIELPFDVFSDTYDLARHDFFSQGWAGKEAVKKVIMDGMHQLAGSVILSHPQMSLINLKRATSIFLKTAEELELILWDLKVQGDQDALQDELVAGMAALGVDASYGRQVDSGPDASTILTKGGPGRVMLSNC